ncbi:MAG TPA: hypothetical protein VFG30_44595 [Polyangiales bacterium]|nr:hypothetical protein [Polyangiales bacterium]
MKRALQRSAAIFAALTVWLSASSQIRAEEPQELNPNADVMRLFTSTRWSMIVPDKDYDGGCVVGFLAFAFSPTGYFTFNNKIRGSWRIDELGNLKLRTRDGLLFTMLVDGQNMRSSRTIPFLSRTMIFQRCPE